MPKTAISPAVAEPRHPGHRVQKQWKCSHCGEWIPVRYTLHHHAAPLPAEFRPGVYFDVHGNKIFDAPLRRERITETPRRGFDEVRYVFLEEAKQDLPQISGN